MSNRKSKLLFGLVVLVTITSVVLAGCGPTPTPVPPTKAPEPTKPPAVPTPTPLPPKPKVLRIAFVTFPDVIDPQKSSFVGEIAMLNLAYEGLTRVDVKGNVVPGAADKWEYKEGGKKLVFHIRDGLKRADGTPITAKDFEYALRREVDPRVPGKQYTSIVYDIKGAQKIDGMDPKKVKSEDIDKALATEYGVKALDASNLEIEFEKPVGFWLYVASTWVVYPSDKTRVDKDPDNWWIKAEGHNGNGPFKVQAIEEGKRIIFVPNPNYWGGKAKLDRIEYVYITDTAVQFEAYKKGELDIIGIAAEDMATVKADPVLSKEWLHGPAAWTSYLGFNNTKKPFTDKNVRIAFSQAFDRKAWAQDILKGLAEPYRSWVPPGVPGYDPTALVPDSDPKAAVETLIKAGYGTPDGKKVDCAKLGEIRITYAATARNHPRFQFIAGNFARVFGCPVILDPVDPTVYTAMVKKVETTPQVFYLGWIEDYHHPQNWLSVFWVCGGFGKRTGYCNKEFDAAVGKADAETDFAKAVELYKAAQKIVINDIPVAFVVYNTYDYLVKPYVIGPKENFTSSDAAWPGGYSGPTWTYDIDLAKVGPGYPTK
jgi:oligopeptide transport system substrate-binding protein